MKVNKQSKIKINKSGFRRSRFNWSHDVNTTFNWGEIQPTQCKMLIPGSKTTMKTQDLIRLAPMVAPTFGRVKYKTFNQFVAMSEIFPNFDAMMAQEPKTTAGGTQVPTEIPSTKLSALSAWCLHGARATIYMAQTTTSPSATEWQNAVDGVYFTAYRKAPDVSLEASNVMWDYMVNRVVASGALTNVNNPYFSATTGFANVGDRVVLDLSKFEKFSTAGSVFPNVKIVLGNEHYRELFPVDRAYTESTNVLKPVKQTMKEVTLDGADYVIEGRIAYNNTTCYVAIALEMSDFGKRFRKILQGCGYQFDLTSTEDVSILPLLAQYKAYFDIFGLQLYQGWETTYASKVIKYIENNFVTSVQSGWTGSAITDTNANSFIYFLYREMLNEWYTEDPDFIGAHMEKLAVSPKVNASGFISVDGSGNIRASANVTQPGSAGADNTVDGQNSYAWDDLQYRPQEEVHGYINQIQHGQVDAELLKRMYKWTNRNTILGREIAKILRAQGLGKYVDECKSNFIGSSDTMITISDVISQAATSDAALGEYGGRGLQYNASGTLVFENDEYGYWVTLATVVPEAGYTQGLDRTLLALGKFDLYEPDFDALGMEITPKNAVVGNKIIAGGIGDYAGDTGFGFIPRMSKFKVCNNVTNGDFNRHGKRSHYLPYTLDKQLNVNDYDTDWTAYTDNFSSAIASIGAVKIDRSIDVIDLPVAGNVWRTPTKYPWMGNFNRIFLNVGQEDKDSDSFNDDGQFIGWATYTDDNFLSHAIYDVQCYAPMKPIEDSYGLEEDETDRAGAEFVTKA